MSTLTAEMKTELINFLKENLSLQVSESSETVDRSYGEYCEKINFKISLLIGEEIISEENIYHYNE